MRVVLLYIIVPPPFSLSLSPLSFSGSLFRIRALNLEYDRPVVRAIGTNSRAIKSFDERSVRTGSGSSAGREESRGILVAIHAESVSSASSSSSPRLQIAVESRLVRSSRIVAVRSVRSVDSLGCCDSVAELSRVSHDSSPRGRHVLGRSTRDGS